MVKVVVATVIVFVGGAFANYLRYSEQMPDRPPMFESIPYAIEPYAGEERRFAESSYDVLKADTTTLRVYDDTLGASFWLFVAYFSSQKYGSQIHSPKNCLPGSGWRIESLEPHVLTLNDGTERLVNRLIIRERTNTQMMFYWFETRGGTVREEFGLKWDLMVNSLKLNPTDAAFIRLNYTVAPGEDIETAAKRGEAFLRTFIPEVESALPFAEQKA